MHHKQQLERMQRLASFVLEECVVFTLPDWQLLCDRRGLACGLELANEHIVNKMGVKLDVVKMKRSTQSFWKNRTFLTKVLPWLCKQSASDSVVVDIMLERIYVKHLIPSKMNKKEVITRQKCAKYVLRYTHHELPLDKGTALFGNCTWSIQTQNLSQPLSMWSYKGHLITFKI